MGEFLGIFQWVNIHLNGIFQLVNDPFLYPELGVFFLDVFFLNVLFEDSLYLLV